MLSLRQVIINLLSSTLLSVAQAMEDATLMMRSVSLLETDDEEAIWPSLVEVSSSVGGTTVSFTDSKGISIGGFVLPSEDFLFSSELSQFVGEEVSSRKWEDIDGRDNGGSVRIFHYLSHDIDLEE